ncbi:MAG: permease-like cell division protein FtsX [Candidatus Taylorbacteria bacterium]
MLWVNTKRVLKSGFVNFWRNGFISLSSILIMVITLFVIGSIIFVSATLQSSLLELKKKVDINVYFVTSAKEADILAVKQSIEKLQEVSSVEYISQDQVLANFKKRHENDQLTQQALEEINGNPLGATLNINAKDPSQYGSIAEYLKSDSTLTPGGASIIDKVNYEQNKGAIETLTSIIRIAEKLGFGITLFLIILSIVITLNTIRLTIYTSREEIAVMRLVGANNMYIRGPFVVAGMTYGLISAIITLLLFYPVTFWLGRVTERFFTGINLFNYYINNFGQIFLIIVGSGILIGAISSFLAVRRYLKI